jgi:hypothetical protein
MKCWYYGKRKQNKLSTEDRKRLQGIVNDFMRAKVPEQLSDASIKESEQFQNACDETLNNLGGDEDSD